jgi:cell division protein FtsB
MNFNREELKTIRSALETAIEDLENEVAIESMIKDYAQMELRKIAPLVIKIDAELEMNK